MADLTKAIAAATSAINTEISALTNFAQSLEANLKPALELILESISETKGHVVVTGLGKSGLVGVKIAATLSSTGTLSFFLHSAVGVIRTGDYLAWGNVMVASAVAY